VLVLLAALSFLIYGLIARFTLEEIECYNQNVKCDPTILESLVTLKGKSLLRSYLNAKDILSKNPSVESFLIKYRPFRKIEVYVSQKRPVVLYASKVRDFNALVDKDGVVIGFADIPDLPRVLVEKSMPSVGEKVDDKDLFAIRLLLEMERIFGVKSGELRQDGVFFSMADGKKAIFPVSGDKDVLIGSLMLIYADLTSSNPSIDVAKNISIIDLRFKNPVLR